MTQDSKETLQFLETNNVDLILMDYYLNDCTGFDLGRIVYAKYSIPIIIISAKNIEEFPIDSANYTFILDILQKPYSKFGIDEDRIHEFFQRIEKYALLSEPISNINTPIHIPEYPKRWTPNKDPLVCIGASTGGLEAISLIIKELPSSIEAPIVIILHIPPNFVASAIYQWNSISKIPVKSISSGEKLQLATIYISSENQHVELTSSGKFCLTPGCEVNGFCPSISVLFQSLLTRQFTRKCMAILLTGLGRDGALELNEIKKEGGETVVQDEESCVVFGMGKRALSYGKPSHYVSLSRIASLTKNFANAKR